jgi:hypothetical protein
MTSILRKASFAFLCIAPFIAGGLGGATPLRQVTGRPLIGIVLFVLIAIAAWTLGSKKLLGRNPSAASGTAFIFPWTLIGLLWTGLGTPWDATASENVMRYEVLAVGSIAITIGFVFLHRVLIDVGESNWATLMLVLAILAGASFLTWACFQTGVWLIKENRGEVSQAIADMNIVLDAQLYFATLLTYVGTVAAVLGMVRAKLLSSRTSFGYLALSAVALVLLVLRGVAFPDPNAASQPWYETPAFIVGIPAMPWLMPFFLGVVLLKRTGDEEFE